MFDEVCRQLQDWKRQNIHLEHVAINVSSKQFRQYGFVEKIKKIIDYYQIPAELLFIEITECALINNFEDTIENMQLLRSKGFKFSIDDFGTGYASLTYLKQLPVDQLKIDQSFIRDLTSQKNDATIV